MCYNLQALGESLGTGDDVKDMDVIEKVMRVSHALKKKKEVNSTMFCGWSSNQNETLITLNCSVV